MGGLSRRHFLQSSAAVAAGLGLAYGRVGSVLAAPLDPARNAPSTLLSTIRQLNVGNAQYRTLVSSAGEPYLPRFDILGKSAPEARTKNRRSLYYLGHLSDVHIIDAQTPARLEPLLAVSEGTFSGSVRPQDTLTVNVLAETVRAMNALRFSPVTGAPVSAFLNTGDNADMHSQLELKWYIETLDGGSIVPNSGSPNVYEGVQAWLDTKMIYHPEAPEGDEFGTYGFPRIPGLLNAAVSQTVVSPGLDAPWYTVFGNHDALYFGFFPIDSAIRQLAVGSQKPYEGQALIENYAAGWAQQSNPLARFAHMISTNFGRNEGFRDVTSDASRALLTKLIFMQAHLDSPADPGPVGHGFTQQNVDSGQTYWSASIGSRLRVFGLDTCNTTLGADGAVPQDQFQWLEAGLADAAKNKQLAIVMSHHNSLTLENGAQPAIGPSQPLIHSEQFVDMLLKYPNMVAWINGHTHINTIIAHPQPDSDGGGFWEITTASCIDFPQQQQMIEIVDNRDGTLSLFTTVVDHAGPPQWKDGDFSQVGLASLSRELASNDFTENPLMRRGGIESRNTELLLRAPFDLAEITDAELEASQLVSRAKFLARDGGVSQ